MCIVWLEESVELRECVCTCVCAGEVSWGIKRLQALGKQRFLRTHVEFPPPPPPFKILNRHSKKEETILICFHSRL